MVCFLQLYVRKTLFDSFLEHAHDREKQVDWPITSFILKSIASILKEQFPGQDGGPERQRSLGDRTHTKQCSAHTTQLL